MSRNRIFESCVVVAAWALVAYSSAVAQDLVFSAPAFLPGDTMIGAAAGHQISADIARGDNQFLVVWSDGRTTPGDYWPFETEGSGLDIYGARLDAAGNLIDNSPIVINRDFGDQVDPQVAWDGSNWLVVWHSPLQSYYDSQLQGVRVAPDGTLLDESPIILHYSNYEFAGLQLAGGAGGWMVLVQSTSAWDSALRGFAIAADGSIPVPGGIIIHDTDFMIDFYLAFAEDEYLVVWEGAFDPPRGRRFNEILQPIGSSFALPFAGNVASDGTDFLIVWASGSPPLASVEAVLVSHQGTLPGAPITLFVQSDGQAGTCCAKAAWDGTYYWVSWGGITFARVSADGQEVVDPGGFQIMPESQAYIVPEIDAAPNGGVQVVWNNGTSGAGYPKDVYTGQIPSADQFENELLVSRGAPTQLDADFAKGDGVHLVVFISHVSGSALIMAQRIDDNGTALDAEPIEVVSGPVPGLGVPTLGAPNAAWNGSLFMITWSDGLEIFARRMLADGSFVDATPLTVMDGFDPDIAAVGDVFLVVGIDLLNDNPEWQATHAMRVHGVTGENLDAVSNALGGFVIFARHPHVVSWGDRWLATWQLNLSHDNTIAGTAAAIINADGTTPGVFGPSLGWRPDVAVSEDAALFVAVSHTISSTYADIEGRIMLADGTFPGTDFLISGAADKQLSPTATWNGSEFIVAWEDKRNSEVYFDERTDIYGARVTESGEVRDPQGIAFAAAEIPEIMPKMMSIGVRTLLASSTFRPESEFCAYRVGTQIHDYALGLTGDLNNDNIVNAADLALLLGNWGSCAGCEPDLNSDGMVDAVDLSLLLGNWS